MNKIKKTCVIHSLRSSFAQNFIILQQQRQKLGARKGNYREYFYILYIHTDNEVLTLPYLPLGSTSTNSE